MKHQQLITLKLISVFVLLTTLNLNAQWSQVGGVAMDLGAPSTYDETSPPVFQQIQINPVTKELYVIGLDLTAGATANRPTVRRFTSGSWTTVGSPQFTDIEAYGLDMAFHPTTGEPYVSFISLDAIPHISVMRFNGVAWVYVGSKDFEESFEGKETRIAIHPTTETPYVVFERRTAPGLIQLSAMSFDGNSWVNAVPSATPYIPNALGSSGMDFKIDPNNGDLIVAARDQTQSTGGGFAASVFISSDGINWSYGAGFAGVTQAYGGSATDLEISFAKNGRRYLKFRQITGGKYYILRAVGTNSWTLNGAPFSNLGHLAYALNDTIPHVMFSTGNPINQGFDLLTYKQPKDEPFRRMGYTNSLTFPVNGYSGQIIGGFSSRNDLVVDPMTNQLYSMHTELSDDANKNLVIKVFKYENSPPTGILLSNNIIEGSRAIGTVIGTFSTSDADTYDIHSYRLQSGGADNASFTISEDGELLSAEVFDENVKSTYDILVRTTDDNLETHDQAFTITVTALDVAPTDITLDNNQQAEGTANTAIGFFSTFDANSGETFTYTKVSGTGSDDNGSFTVSSATGALSRAVAPFDYDVKSSYSIRVRSTETDNASNFIEKVFTIEVLDVDAAPVLSSTVSIPNPINLTEDETFTYELPEDLFEDEENGPLFYSIYSSQPPTKNPPVSWVTIDELTGTLTGTPGNSNVGTSAVHYIHVTDGVNNAVASNAFSFNVQNVNDPPQVSTSTILVSPNATEDAAYTSNVIFLPAYFSDQDPGDVLSYSVTNQDDTPVSWLTLTINPANGSGTITGTPLNEDVGINQYKITATDQGSASVSCNLQLTVTNTNDAPIVSNLIPDQIISSGISFQFQFAANTFQDPDIGTTLVYQADQTTGGGLPAWMSFNGSTRTFSGTPPPAEDGNQYSIRVTASDPGGLSVFDDFLVDIVANDPPQLDNAISNQSATEDAAFSFQFPGNTFSDPNGDPLSYSVSLQDDSPLPSWLGFSSATRTFSGTPLNGDVGVITVKLAANDGKGGNATDQFDLTVINTNDAPVVDNQIPNQSTDEDLFFSFQFAANTFSDPDVGDALTYSLSTAPDWIAIDSDTRTLSGTPGNSDVGTVSIMVTATDQGNAFVSTEFSITVNNVNDAPTVANPIEDLTIPARSLFQFTVPSNTFEDVDLGDVVVLSANLSDDSGLPEWLTFEASTSTFSGTPDEVHIGTITISLTATDQSNASVQDDFSITITKPLGLNSENDFILFPNPSNDYIKLDAVNVDVEKVQILSIQGNIISEYLNDFNTINISDLPTGNYFLRIISKSGNKVGRFIKAN